MDVEHHDSGSQLAVDVAGPPDRFRAISSPRRIAILAALARNGGSMELSGLARAVSATECRKNERDVTRREERTVLTSLQHAHLPTLVSRSLVEWDEDDAISLSSDVAVPQLRERLQNATPLSSVRRLRTLSHPRRRSIVEILARQESPISVDELGRLVAATEVGSSITTPPDTAVDRVRVSLVHSHLPALAAAGFLEYDDDAGVVSADSGLPN